MQEEIRTLEALEEGDKITVTVGNGNELKLTVGWKKSMDSLQPKARLMLDGRNFANLWGYKDGSLKDTVRVQTINCEENDTYTVTDIEVA